jgi:arginyl-tRNA synthetase
LRDFYSNQTPIMDIVASISSKIKLAIHSLYSVQEEVLLQPTRKDFEGDYTFVCFTLVKTLKKSPAEIGTQIGQYLTENHKEIESFNVVQGFLNIKLKADVWLQALSQMAFENIFPSNGEKVMVEFSSPNTNKPLHLGHLRNNFLGDSIAKILEAAGFEVVKACLVNDRGIHICKSMVAYQLFGENETPLEAKMKGDHMVGKYYVAFDKLYKSQIEELMAQGHPEEYAKKNAPIMLEAQNMLVKWEEGELATLALWKKMNAWVYEGFDKTYEEIGVNFDKKYYESETYLLGKDLIEEGLKNNVFYKKPDNSVWIDLTEEGLDEKLVLRGDGTSVYITQDLGTTDLKFDDFKADKSIWVVGNEQDYHFKVLFAIMKKLGRSYAAGCFHMSYGMVDLPSGKMKSREGTVVDADEMVAEMIATAEATTTERGKINDFSQAEAQTLFKTLAMGALKYFLLKVEPKKRMLFDPAESIDFQGNTGPFIQYTHARIKSILRKTAAANPTNLTLDIQLPLNAEETEIIYLLSDYPTVIQKAAKEYSPALIANYVYELAKTFNSFYATHSVMNESHEGIKQMRLILISKVAQVIQHAMGLLGIRVPERM